MRLKTKLTLFNAISKLVIVTLFVLILPSIITLVNESFTDSKLRKQKNQLLNIINKAGVDDYVYATYSPLKEEYYSLDLDSLNEDMDTIKVESRKIESDTIQYRILSHNFKVDNKNYLLEIGKSVDTIDETTSSLQNIAFQILVGLILLTILADLLYTNHLLRPLGLIIKTKLVGRKFPDFGSYVEVKTTTSDFQHLDISIHKMVETIEQTFQKEREFISNASHELMTPISILQSKIENMFEQDDVTDDVKVRLLEMQKILNRLKSITKTLLLISQIENEQFLKEDKIAVEDMLQQVHEEISIKLPEKNISYNMHMPGNWIFVGINKFLLFNLFFNLINNAIKYNREEGDIKVIGEVENNIFSIRIIDTGMGISADDMPYIFNRFKKLKQSLQQESFGLGLPIVKSIAGFHGIEIIVESEQGVGSTFKLIFPANIIQTQA